MSLGVLRSSVVEDETFRKLCKAVLIVFIITLIEMLILAWIL